MPQLRIERVPISGLQFNGFDHMHLVLERDPIEDSTYPQDDWFGIEGTFSGPAIAPVLSTLGGNGITTLPQLNMGLTGADLQAAIGTPGARGSRVLPVSGDPLVAWNFMAALARDIDNQNLPYQAQILASRYSFNINSSSVAATLLYSIGIEIANNLPFGIERSNGWQTLIGSSGDDTLRVESTFVNLVGGLGNDRLHGSNTDDQYERFEGGVGDDIFFWSEGSHTYHGGQRRLDYTQDGVDIVDYANVGEVSLELNPGRVPHFGADLIATHATGVDYLLSIEKLRSGLENDVINFGEGLDYIHEGIVIDLGDQASLGQGDQIRFLTSDVPIQLVAATNSDYQFVQALGATDDDAGVWITSAEWLVGSEGNDKIYLGWAVRGVEGGGGDDLIDVREVTAFDARSPDGYDIEIIGGSGDDTIVAGHGRVSATGGDGSDIFIVSEFSIPANGMNELIITDASPDDRLFASYNFFNESFAPFEGAELFPLLGAISQFPGQASFSDLPQHQGPFTDGQVRSDFFAFSWQTNNDRFFKDDATDGVIDFAGDIFYNRDGNDLLIHVFAGFSIESTEIGANGTPYTFTDSVSVISSEVQIRVVDFQEGDLGINFYDIGVGQDFSYSRFHGDYTGRIFPNWDQTIGILTNNGVLTPPLDPRPGAPTYDPDDDAPPPDPDIVIGTNVDDVITIATATNQDVSALEGDDTITTSEGDDRIDGGEGVDTMSGGEGDDTYIVDNAADTIIEAADGGLDTVLSSVSFVLPDHVEDLTLVTPESQAAPQSGVQRTALNPTTLDGTGNALRNTLVGNSDANQLDGLDGDDVLYGALGNDVLIGGGSSDSYIYFSGDGDDQILDLGDGTDVDQLYLEGIASDAIRFYQLTSTPEDLTIAFENGGRVSIIDFFVDDGNNNGIDIVNASDEVSWTRSNIDTIVAATGLTDNQAPQAGNEDSFALRGPNAVLPAALLLANDVDYDGDPLNIVAVSSDNAAITTTLNASGDVVLTSPLGFEGAALLTYTVSDGRGGTASATTGVLLYPNQAPDAASIANQTTLEDTPWSFTLPSGFYNDPDGDPVTLTATLANGDPVPGWLTFDANSETFSGTPPENFNGLLTFSVVISDGEAATTRTFDLEITPVNDAPDAQNDQGFETDQDTPITLLASDLLSNDSDVDGDTLTISSVDTASNGTVALDTNGDVLFTPTPGYFGPASFDYTVSDGAGGNATASVALDVLEDPNPPNPATIIGTNNNDVLVGTGNADIFDGLGGNDIMRGRGGDDIFLGGDGADVMRGGSGFDTINYSASPNGISLFIFGKSGFGSGGDAAGDWFYSIEHIIGSAHDDTIRAIWGETVLDGGAGNDHLISAFGSNSLRGGPGSDVLTGGFNDDSFYFSDGDGADRVTDFRSDATAGWGWFGDQSDTLVLDVDGVDTFADLTSLASEVAGDTVFDFGNNDRLTLQNIRLAQISEADVQFV